MVPAATARRRLFRATFGYFPSTRRSRDATVPSPRFRRVQHDGWGPMSDTAEYITLLVISIVITIAVGQVLMVSGRPFLLEVFEDEKVTSSINRLLSVLFYLITIGVLTIISVWSIDVGSQLQNMVVKLGIVLIVLGIAYGVSMLVLIRVRERRRADQISEEVQMKLSDQGVSTHPAPTPPTTTTTPVQQVSPPNGL